VIADASSNDIDNLGRPGEQCYDKARLLKYLTQISVDTSVLYLKSPVDTPLRSSISILINLTLRSARSSYRVAIS
jgi:hypothetical protein